jgi:uncharacterized protein YdeI (YjbR/CyaY-like superfamily)
MKEYRMVSAETLPAWRAWLRAHHGKEREAWLVLSRKGSGRPSVSDSDAAEEALCWGWIDSIIKRLDDDRYAQKFTPRTDRTKWSPSNRERLRRLLAAGRMTAAGLAQVDPEVLASLDASPDRAPRPAPTLPPELEALLRANEKAWQAFQRLAPSHRRNYIGWIVAAKRDETRRRRLAEAISKLEQGLPLGLK